MSGRPRREMVVDGDAIMTSAEVAEFLKVHLGSVRRWSRSGKLKGYRLGVRGDWRYLRKDVLNFFYDYNRLMSEGGDAVTNIR